ncbi:MAG: hypothetical protein K2H03_02630, partial [Muribaculaceae bacterium]|nr:hypothetical protein [Muribaculaceae bacterium]
MRRCTADILYAVAMTAALSCWSCSQESAGPVPEADPGYRTIVLSLTLGAENPMSRGDFDNFDNEADKWGVQGENIESLRIIILDGRNVVEHNSLYTLDNDSEAGEYRFSVSDNDTKTIIFICNEDGLTVRPEDSPASGALSLSDYLRSISEGGTADVAGLRRMVVDFDPNSVDGAGTSLRRPLPITAIYNEYIAAGVEDISREYELRRAAVKYSFRIINKSAFAQTLDAIRIDRVADREYLFPAETGQGDTRSYSTPAGAAEKTLRIKPAAPLSLPAGMTQAVTAMEPVYVPEGIISELPRRVSLALDGTDLDLWQSLKWRMPGESEAVERSMADLPRNTHVVVNITITEESKLDIVADVQPYAEVKVDPWFGLDRDEDGNIIVER